MEFDLNNIYFNVAYYDKKYILIVSNNCKIETESDSNTSNIKITPYQIYFFDIINVNKFQGQNQLNYILKEFLKTQENSNIIPDRNKQENDHNQNNLNEYIKLNEYNYIYYNVYPIDNKYCMERIFKGFTFAMQICLIILGLIVKFGRDKEKMFFPYFFGCYFYNFIVNVIGICTYYVEQSCLRIEFKFSFNFDKITIRCLNSDRNIYNNTSEFNINELDRFILEKNNFGYNLNVILKGDISRLICNINYKRIEIQGLINILNEKIVNYNSKNNNNIEQQHLNECPPPIAITPD